MNQQTTQIQKYTPETLFPRWTQIIDNYSKNIETTNTHLNIHDSKTCIIGEAHNFTKSYLDHCDICHRLSVGGLPEHHLDSFLYFLDDVKPDWRDSKIIKFTLEHFQNYHT